MKRILLSLLTISGAFIYHLCDINECMDIVADNSYTMTQDTIIESEVIIEPELQHTLAYSDGWVEASTLNIRNKPSMSGEIIGSLSFNEEVQYVFENTEWLKIQYNNEDAYVYKDYIIKEEPEYSLYAMPETTGFKSYMDYKYITSVSSYQYKLQKLYAVTGDYGIRMVDNRYCIAVGSHFNTKIGQYIDLILENGTVIPCVMADMKADIHTDETNIISLNGCVSEFVIDGEHLNADAKYHGDISACTEEWDSPVVQIKVYNKNIFNEQE